MRRSALPSRGDDVEAPTKGMFGAKSHQTHPAFAAAASTSPSTSSTTSSERRLASRSDPDAGRRGRGGDLAGRDQVARSRVEVERDEGV